jgi:hypothetical protein
VLLVRCPALVLAGPSSPAANVSDGVALASVGVGSTADSDPAVLARRCLLAVSARGRLLRWAAE